MGWSYLYIENPTQTLNILVCTLHLSLQCCHWKTHLVYINKDELITCPLFCQLTLAHIGNNLRNEKQMIYFLISLFKSCTGGETGKEALWVSAPKKQTLKCAHITLRKVNTWWLIQTPQSRIFQQDFHKMFLQESHVCVSWDGSSCETSGDWVGQPLICLFAGCHYHFTFSTFYELMCPSITTTHWYYAG